MSSKTNGIVHRDLKPENLPIGAGAYAMFWFRGGLSFLAPRSVETTEIVHVSNGNAKLLQMKHPPKEAFASRCGDTSGVTVLPKTASEERWAKTIPGLAICVGCARARQ